MRVLLVLLHLTLLPALPLRRPAPPLPLRPGPPAHLFHLPRFCTTPTCIARFRSLLRGCDDVRHHAPLRLIRASCRHPPGTDPPARALPRQRLLSATFRNITRLTFSPASATTPQNRTIRLPPCRACSRARGAGVTVYVIDTGCRSTHEQLAGRVATLPAPGSAFRSGEDDHGHGTHVAATIAGRDVGLAPRARLVCIKALSSDNEGNGGDVMAGIREAVRMHRPGTPGIISISLGVRAGSRYTALDDVIARAADVGILSVVAAGNAGGDACTFTPARASSAITVAAVGRDGKLARFSNRGRCVVVGAPGVGVWSAVAKGDRLYGVSSGTSMAAPFVSGLVALRLSEAGVVGVREMREWLRRISRESRGLRVVSIGKFCRWMKTR